MRMSIALPLLLVALVLHTPSVSVAASQEQVEQLQAEIALLKMKLRDAQKKADQPTVGRDEEKSDTQKPNKPIRDVTDLLRMFPAEAQPNPDNGVWSKPAAEEAQLRLNYAVWGVQYRDEAVLKSITVQENPALKEDASASPWVFYMKFEPKVIEYHNRDLRQSFADIKFFGDDALARRARKLDVGDKLRVSGDLVTIRVMHLSTGTFMMTPTATLQLRNLEIEGFIRP